MMRLVDSSAACHNNETFVTWNVEGPAGRAGPVGPVGPAGPVGPPGPLGSGGAPFVWICTPANLPSAGGSPRDDVYIFNGSSSIANVSVNILDASGNNLQGHTIPGSPGPTSYPGDADGATVSLSPAHTREVNWVMPNTTANPSTDTDVAMSVRVVSDQPIVVGANFEFNGSIPSQCSLLPK